MNAIYSRYSGVKPERIKRKNERISEFSRHGGWVTLVVLKYPLKHVAQELLALKNNILLAAEIGKILK